MIEVLGRRRFEGINLAALWIDTRHNVLDGAIFAGGVHSLKNQQHGPFVLRVKLVLQLCKGLNADSQRLFGPRFSLRLEVQSVRWIHILHPKLFSVGDAERFCKLPSFFDDFIGVHRRIDSTPLTAKVGTQNHLGSLWPA